MCLGNMAVTVRRPILRITGFIESIEEVCFQLMMRHSTFFIAVEKVTWQHLPQQHTSQSHEIIKQSVMKAISEDVDVQFLDSNIP